MNQNEQSNNIPLPPPREIETTDQFLLRRLGHPSSPNLQDIRDRWVKANKERDEALKRRSKAKERIEYWLQKARIEDQIIIKQNEILQELDPFVVDTFIHYDPSPLGSRKYPQLLGILMRLDISRNDS